jgi:hypothetical protein
MSITHIGIDNTWSFASSFEAPNGKDPNQNAWLTITIRYRLNFVDGYNDKAGLTVESDDGKKHFALDSDKNMHPILPWDAGSKMRFSRDFPRGENIWNFRFVLITPPDYDELDYEKFGLNIRPNVLCLFRLVPDNYKPHLPIDVVRLDPSVDGRNFRSNKNLYVDTDLYRPTLGHELGHALGLGHIKEMLGDARCIADAKRGVFPNRCYGETEVEKANIMGSGTAVTLLCAKPWLDRIAEHSLDSMGVQNTRWTATLDTARPPQRLPRVA